MKRWAISRAQAAALAALCFLVTICALSVGFALQMRSEAMEQLSESRSLLARLSGRAAASGGSSPAVGQAPPAAIIEAATHGHAGAELQAHLSRTALGDRAFVMSTGVEGETKGEPDTVRVQAVLEASFAATQALLYHLETGTPYLSVESLTIQPSGSTVRRTMEDAPFRVTVVLRGLWRRASQ
jgi:general secretion pathway protein M